MASELSPLSEKYLAKVVAAGCRYHRAALARLDRGISQFDGAIQPRL